MTTEPSARPTRRAIAKGTAWAVPAIAVGAAAPQAAASPCAPQAYTVDWAGGSGTVYTRTNDTSGTATADPDGAGPIPPITVNVSSMFLGGAIVGTSGGTVYNYRVSGGPVGGTGDAGLLFYQQVPLTNTGRAARQVITFSFTEAVQNLRFTITDIDSANQNYRDSVDLTGVFTPTITNPTYVTGSGTQPSPLTSNGTNLGIDSTSSNGNVLVRYPGPLSSFTLNYWNSNTTFGTGADRQQLIYVTALRFDVVRNTC